MEQEERINISAAETGLDNDQGLNYNAFISCLCKLMLEKDKNKDIDKKLIEE